MPSLQNVNDAIKIIKGFSLPGEWIIISPGGHANAGKDLDKLVQLAKELHKQANPKFPNKDTKKR